MDSVRFKFSVGDTTMGGLQLVLVTLNTLAVAILHTLSKSKRNCFISNVLFNAYYYYCYYYFLSSNLTD